MTYEAYVTYLKGIRRHPNADRLLLANASNYQVITSLSTKETDLGVFFESDGKLSHEMLYHNNLYRHKEKNLDQTKGGFFEDNGKIRYQKFRGEASEGFWVPINYLSWTGVDLSKLKEGDSFDKLNGKLICEKFVTRATKKAMQKNNTKLKQIKMTDRFPTFAKHFDTEQLRTNIQFIPKGAIISISCKLHGTSMRVGRCLSFRPNWYEKSWNYFVSGISFAITKFLRIVKKSFKKIKILKISKALGQFEILLRLKVSSLQAVGSIEEYEYVTGTRNVILDPNIGRDPYYEGTSFRQEILEKIKKIGLRKGETLYGEIVGWEDGEQGKPIMGTYKVEDEEIKKLYGNKIIFSYGCSPGTHRVFIYRITITGPDGYHYDLPWHEMINRCRFLGLEPVPQLVYPFVYESQEQLLKLCKKYADGPSTLDPTHPREGVVIRIEHPDYSKFLKWKGVVYAELEGIAKNDSFFVDVEEIS